MPAPPEDGIGTSVAEQRIVAGPAVDKVVVGTAKDGVATAIAVQCVGTVFAVYFIVTETAGDDIGAGAAIDGVVSDARGHNIEPRHRQRSCRCCHRS